MPAYEYAYIMNAMEQSGTSSSKLLQTSGGHPSKINAAAAAPASGSNDEVRYSTDAESIVKGTDEMDQPMRTTHFLLADIVLCMRRSSAEA